MRAALREARKGLGQTSPNPAVGAVLVIDGKIVAKGHHERAGWPHAEIECLRSFKKPIPKSAILYVTLEPCSTTGRTGPCTDAIIEAGVRRCGDWRDRSKSKARRARNRAARRSGPRRPQPACWRTNAPRSTKRYNKWIQTGRPFVIAKCGMSLDGRLSPPPGEARWITSAASRRHAQQLRAQVDAILIGAETLRADNPRLTVRGHAGAKQPWRIVLSRSGTLPAQRPAFHGSIRRADDRLWRRRIWTLFCASLARKKSPAC